MKMKIKNIFKSKSKVAIPIIISIVIVFGLIMPCDAQAILNGQKIANAIFSLLAQLLIGIAGFFANLGTAFMEAMLSIGFKKQQDIVSLGWKETRNIANMFFILFMVVIALSTILRIENYGAKKLLPKLIGAALLINFSMVFCYMIIDVSNIVSESFINSAHKVVGGKGEIAFTLRNSLKVEKNITYTECAQGKENALKECREYNEDDADATTKCEEKATKNFEKCNEQIASILKDVSPSETFLNTFLTSIFTVILLSVTAFTMFAGGILLVIRMLYLWILVIIAPLAVICLIFPALHSNWQKWWEKFWHWCLFAPIFSFFVWLAVKVAKARIIDKLSEGSTAGLTITAFGPEKLNPSINVLDNIIGFAFIIGLMLGGLITAQSLGLTGSKAIMKLGTNIRKGAIGFTKKRLASGGKLLGAEVLKDVGESKLFKSKLFKKTGLGLVGDRMSSKGTKMLQSRAQTEKNKEFDELTNNMSDNTLENEALYAIGIKQLIATKKALSRGLLAKTKNRDVIKQSISTLKAYGYVKEADEIKASRIDIVEDGKMEEEINKTLSKKEQGNWKSSVFEPKEGRRVISAFIKASGGSVSDFLTNFKGLNRLAQQKALERMTELFSDDFINDPMNIDARKMYAAATGEVGNAYRDIQKDKEGKVELDDRGRIKFSKTINPKSGNALQGFVKGMKPRDFAELDPASVADIAPFISSSIAVEIGRYLSSTMKEGFAQHFSEDVKKELAGKDAWKTYIPDTYRKTSQTTKSSQEDEMIKKAEKNLRDI